MVRVFAVAFGLLFPVVAAFAEPRETLRFGVAPQGSPSEVLRIWQPVAQALERAIRRPIVVVTEPDIPTFEACLHRGAYDIAYMNPYHYVIFSQTTGYRAVAHRADALLAGVVVVHNDAPFQSVQDLDGTRLAFPSPAAFAASILVRAELRAAGVRFEPIYSRSHESGYLAVARQILDAAGGVSRTLEVFLDGRSGYDVLRVVHTTKSYTPHPIAVAAWVPPDLETEIAETLFDLHLTHPEVLQRLAIGRFGPPGPDAYEDVRALSLPVDEAGINLAGDPPCRSG